MKKPAAEKGQTFNFNAGQHNGDNIGIQNNYYGRQQRHLTDAIKALVKSKIAPGAPIKFEYPMDYEECIRFMYEIKEWLLSEGYRCDRWSASKGSQPRPGLVLIEPDPLATRPGYSPPIPDGETWTIYVGPAA